MPSAIAPAMQASVSASPPRQTAVRTALSQFGVSKAAASAGGTPFGIEISEELFRTADATMRRRGGYAIHAPAIDGIRKFDDNYFTGIVLRSFLEHEVKPKELLFECARVLDDGGAIYVRVPNFGSVNRRLLGFKWCGFRYPDHVNYFTVRSLSTMAQDSGLELKLINPLRLPLDDNINGVLRPVS